MGLLDSVIDSDRRAKIIRRDDELPH